MRHKWTSYLQSAPQITPLSTKFMHERGGVPQLDIYPKVLGSQPVEKLTHWEYWENKFGEPAGHNHAPRCRLSDSRFWAKPHDATKMQQLLCVKLEDPKNLHSRPWGYYVLSYTWSDFSPEEGKVAAGHGHHFPWHLASASISEEHSSLRAKIDVVRLSKCIKSIVYQPLSPHCLNLHTFLIVPRWPKDNTCTHGAKYNFQGCGYKGPFTGAVH